MRRGGFFDDASEDGTGRGTPLIAVTPFDTTQITSPENRSRPQAGAPCHPLAKDAHPPAIAFEPRMRGDDGRGYDREHQFFTDTAPAVNTVKPPAVCAFNLRGREGGAMPESAEAASLRAASGGSSRSYVAFSAKDSGADAGEVAPTLRAGGHTGSHQNGGVMPAVAITPDVADPLSANEGHTTSHAGNNPTKLHNVVAGVRRLTPRECERLQGWPDDHTRFRRNLVRIGNTWHLAGGGGLR